MNVHADLLFLCFVVVSEKNQLTTTTEKAGLSTPPSSLGWLITFDVRHALLVLVCTLSKIR
jgi:hypothetical protein